MIRKLKLKLILLIMSIISILAITIILIINLIVFEDINRKIFDSLKTASLVEEKGYSHNNEKHKTKPILSSSTFIVKLTKNNKLIEVIYPENVNITNFNITVEEIKDILCNNRNIKHKRFFKKDNFAYTIFEKPYEKIIVFEDISVFNETKEKLIYASIFAYIFSFMLIFIISYLITDWITKPVKENFDMQKEFVANASHELKTPLSIISTNISILKDSIGDNNIWYDNINAEIFNINNLINQLITLSKSELLEENNNKTNIDLSYIIKNIIFQYEVICFEKNKKFFYEIEDNIFINANEEDIITILKIFLDNAIKYSEENGDIKITLSKNKNKTVLSFFNTGIGIENKYKEKIFERFFRVDTSRNKDIEGYGLGLSIASKIIKNNKWKIKVESIYTKWIDFTIII